MKSKPPTKREREKALVNHNVPMFLKSIGKVRKRLQQLDCALAEMNLYGELISPFAEKGPKK